MRNTFINTIIEACEHRDDIFILSGDAGLGVFDDFQKQYPDRFRNMGVAEQNTISFAAGLALSGYKVVVYNIIPFLLYRCYEQVRNDICYQELPIVLAGIGSGVTYAPMGMTHYSVEDLGLIQTLPNLVTLSPIDPVEARLAALHAIESDKPVYVRLAKRGEPTYHAHSGLDIAAPQIVKQGGGSAIVFHGSISDEVLVAHELLKLSGISPLLVSVPMIQPLNEAALMQVLAEVSHVVCVEEHFVNCGLGSLVGKLRQAHNPPWRLTSLGIPHHQIHDVRSTQGFRRAFGITADDIAQAVKAGTGK